MTYRTSMALCSVMAAVAAALFVIGAASAPVSQAEAVRDTLQKSRDRLTDHFTDVQTNGGSPVELLSRLDADLSTLPHDASASVDEAVALTAALDESLVDQLVSDKLLAASDVRGAAALLVRSSTDHSLQPLALYVPSGYDGKRALPLVVMMHGQGQTENQLLATPYLRALADESQALVAAPFARGDRGFDDKVASDVYDTLAMLESSLNVDRRRVYLAGYSMGGFAIFMVAPQHPRQWSALLAIAGSITNDDKESVTTAMSGKRVLFVAGAGDQTVKAQYVRGAAAYLLQNGVDSRYYEQPDGVHSLSSLQPAVRRAWRDMFSGVGNIAPIEVPSPQPTSSRRT